MTDATVPSEKPPQTETAPTAGNTAESTAAESTAAATDAQTPPVVNEDPGLSDGAIAGIAIGSIAGVAALGEYNTSTPNT